MLLGETSFYVVRYILYAPEYNVIFMSYILLCI
jgi:hypothetical protein